MRDSGVGELRLRIRTDREDAKRVREEGEGAVRTVLERCAALLDARSPGRIALIRRLPLRWRLDEEALEDNAAIDELTRATADAIERIATPMRLDRLEAADPARAAVFFDDEPHLFAAHLLASARGHPDWFQAALTPDDAEEPLAALAAPSRRETAVAALTNLARAGALAEALAAQPPAAVAVLAAALGVAKLRPAPRLVSASLSEPAPALSSDRRFMVDELAAVAAAWPPLAEAARALALQTHAALSLSTDLGAAGARDLAFAVVGRMSAKAKLRDAPRGGDESVSTAAMRPSAAAVDEPGAPSPPNADAPAVAAAETDRWQSYAPIVSTRCAGLFFLLGLVHELDLMETLWKACLPEGAALSAAFAALIGPDFVDDPALALCGGVDSAEQALAPSQEQFEEIATSLCAALADALPRRGLAELPVVSLSLVDTPTGRLLAAAAEGSPFVLFAWPASTREDLDDGLRAFLGAWPPSGALFAPPALAALDRSGRVGALAAVAGRRLRFPIADTSLAAALLALVAGAPCQLLASRAGATGFDDASAFVSRFLLGRAHVRLVGDEMEVLLAEDCVDFDLRRAGLDRDPGHLPWLDRALRFAFVEPPAPSAQ